MFQKKVLALSLEAFDVYWYTFFAKKGSTHIILYGLHKGIDWGSKEEAVYVHNDDV